MSLRSIARDRRRQRWMLRTQSEHGGLERFRGARVRGALLALPGWHVVTVIDLPMLLRALDASPCREAAE